MSLLVRPFPEPGEGLKQAYRELEVAQHGTEAQQKALGDLNQLPRPWVPDTLNGGLRRELWAWLEQVVPWLNEHYTWEISTAVPVCWDRHPHLVLELATVADLRHRASRSLTGDALEDWHRYCLPTFLDRMRSRMRGNCETKHVAWPGRSRQARFEEERDARAGRARVDVRAWAAADQETAEVYPSDFADDQTMELPVYRVDPVTGEVCDDRR